MPPSNRQLPTIKAASRCFSGVIAASFRATSDHAVVRIEHKRFAAELVREAHREVRATSEAVHPTEAADLEKGRLPAHVR